ncbi:hypothetical protein D1872_262590 [compost metagenome]
MSAAWAAVKLSLLNELSEVDIISADSARPRPPAVARLSAALRPPAWTCAVDMPAFKSSSIPCAASSALYFVNAPCSSASCCIAFVCSSVAPVNAWTVFICDSKSIAFFTESAAKDTPVTATPSPVAAAPNLSIPPIALRRGRDISSISRKCPIKSNEIVITSFPR